MTDALSLEKLALLLLAAMSVAALWWIAWTALGAAKLDPNAATLLGAIVAGLIAFTKDIVQAIRGYAMSAQLGKVTDQLAASGPVVDPTTPTGKAGDPTHVVEDAA